MTGANLAAEEELVCRRNGFPLLQKPFLAQDIMSLIRNRLSGAAACPA